MATYKKITDVDTVEKNDQMNVLVDDSGALKKVPVAQMGGGNEKAASFMCIQEVNGGQLQFSAWDELIAICDTRLFETIIPKLSLYTFFDGTNPGLCAVQAVVLAFDFDAVGATQLPLIGIEVKFALVNDWVRLNIVDRTVEYIASAN